MIRAPGLWSVGSKTMQTLSLLSAIYLASDVTGRVGGTVVFLLRDICSTAPAPRLSSPCAESVGRHMKENFSVNPLVENVCK